MNNFYYEVLEYDRTKNAEEGINQLIKNCDQDGEKILEIREHVTLGGYESMYYTFFVKISTDSQ
ncbi:hypothetical protein [Salicibibacter kimchii]|uniref:Uncharacterized protein n=1 Tax=Salicibibacter kimchii TaxID=2099786 RepID=A0A345C2I3_9BACI|nr:hypothetical protein [Salicibibacter kimchii]AXF57414.1 hypothetical protein DT065_16435 [Salicibibacter kimchii]